MPVLELEETEEKSGLLLGVSQPPAIQGKPKTTEATAWWWDDGDGWDGWWDADGWDGDGWWGDGWDGDF
jgi:hypothetical protein